VIVDCLVVVGVLFCVFSYFVFCFGRVRVCLWFGVFGFGFVCGVFVAYVFVCCVFYCFVCVCLFVLILFVGGVVSFAVCVCFTCVRWWVGGCFLRKGVCGFLWFFCFCRGWILLVFGRVRACVCVCACLCVGGCI